MNMEFFEEAHTLKSIDDVKKDSKSEEKVKKQLKQMLFGYKKSDNELIRNSENVIVDVDDNSVSGFSELNLTNSLSDNESTKATLDSSDLDSVSNLIEDEDVIDSAKVLQVEYLSDKDSVVLSSSDDIIFNQQNNCETSETLEESSLFSGKISSMCSSPESTIESDSSSLFDPDGVLALKIHDKLKKQNVSQDNKKRKYNKYENSINNESQLTEESLSSSECEQLNEGKKTKKKLLDSDSFKVNLNNSSTKQSYFLPNNRNVLYSTTPSPTFVSVTAEDLKTEKFDDVMGHYKYATIKNITEQSNTTLSTLNSYHDWLDENVEKSSLTKEHDSEKNMSKVNLTECESTLLVQNDSIILDDDTVQSEIISETGNSVESVEDIIERYEVFNGKNCIIVVLKHPAELYVHGKVIIKKLAGSAQLYGHNLKDLSYEVYAPLYNYAHCLQTVESNNNYYGLFNKLTTRGISVADAEKIVTSLGSYDVVVALEKLKNFKIDFVESNFNTTNLFTKSTENVEPNLKSAAEFLGCSFYSSQPYKHLEECPNWQQAIQFGLSKKSRGIICGGKGGGKSTFLRYYVNQLLSQGPVLVIDLDPGQCEFTVAGSISATIVSEPLLGPNYTHLRRPEIMLNIGMINTMDNSRRYLSAVDAIFTRCAGDERLRSMPWIVNTMGMCNAIGLKFITYIILRTKPTFLLQIELQGKKKNFEYRLTPQKVDELYNEQRYDRFFAKLNLQHQQEQGYAYIASQAQSYRADTNTRNDNFTLAPRDERYLNLLAYFGELAQLHKSLSLLGITPYSVDLRNVYIATNIKVNKESITKVLNGKVVALCQHSTQSDNTAKVFTLSDKPLLCYGHGIVRGIEKDVIYMITPTSPDELALVNTILYADWVPELRGQERNLPEGTAVPYRMQSQYQQKELMFAPRRRFNPLQLLRMSRNS